MWLVKHCLTVLLRTFFFSFLILSQVGCIHSIHAISETLSDSSAWNVFFSFLILYIQTMRLVKHYLDSSAQNVFFSFLIVSQVGYIHSNHGVSETLSVSSARNVFFGFLMISQVGYIHSNHEVSETSS